MSRVVKRPRSRNRHIQGEKDIFVCKKVLAPTWTYKNQHTIQNRCDNPVNDNKGSKDICFSPPLNKVSSLLRKREMAHRSNKWTPRIGDHGPVKGKKAHAEAMVISKEIVDDSAIRPDPTHPVEHAESGEEITRNKVPQKAAEESEEEEALA